MRRQEQLATRNPEYRVHGLREPTSGAIKSILFHVHEDEALEARLQTALSLARAASAHLQLLHVIPAGGDTALDLYGITDVSGEFADALEERAEALKIRLQGQLAFEDVSWSYEEEKSSIPAAILQKAALSDLLVIGRTPYWHEFNRTGPSLIGDILGHSRTPLLIPGDRQMSLDPLAPAVISWNGSIEAANAVRSAIGLLQLASSVQVIRYVEDKAPRLGDIPLLEYLSAHGIHAEIETHLPKSEIPLDLVDQAKRIGAQAIVIGGYSHSRTGEFLFGGVTRSLLKACEISLLMAR